MSQTIAPPKKPTVMGPRYAPGLKNPFSKAPVSAIEKEQLVAAMKRLIMRVEQFLAGERDLTEVEMKLINDLTLWYDGYKKGAAAAMARYATQ